MDLASFAVCTIRPLPHYRREAFLAGLKAAGYAIISSGSEPKLKPTDLYVTWNRYGANADGAWAWERRGGLVLVVENGYVGADAEGRQYYAIAADAHNGAGCWPEPTHDRLAALNIDFKPWRTRGDHILICGARGIGPPGQAQPPGWELQTYDRLKKLTKRPIRVRRHPGANAPSTPLADDLRGCWAVVTWGSNCATEALIAGIPVFYCGPFIATAGAAIRGIESIENPLSVDRLATFQRLAWMQWSVAEIESGEPFARLRDRAHQQPHRLQSVR